MFDPVAFTQWIQSFVDFWNEHDGCATCEFSAGYDEHLPAKMKILDEFNGKIKNGIWLAQHCGTCVGHSDGAKPLHVMIWDTTPKYPQPL